MKDPNQLDDLVRRKLSQRHHSPPPGAWEAAEQELAAQAAPKRRRRGWGWWLLALLALTGGLWAWHAGTSDPDSEVDGSLAEAASVAASSASSNGFPVIETEPCPPAASPGAAAARTRTDQVASPPATPGTPPPPGADAVNAGLARGEPPALSAAASKRREKPLPSGQLPPEGSEQADLAAVYALARRDMVLPTRTLKPLAKTEVIPLSNPAQQRYALQVEAGLGLSQSWQNVQLSARDPLALPVLGLGLSRTFTPRLRVQVGLRYQRRGGLDSDSTFRLELRGFGRNDTLVTVAPQRLHFLGLPVRLDLRLAGRHYLQVGAQANWLLKTSSRLITQVENDLGRSQVEQTQQGGFRQGFAPWDVQLLMGYRYYLGRGLRLGLSGSYGLRDLTQRSFFNNDATNRAWNLRVMLEYDLARF